jgi:cell division septation protein DedD
MPYNKAAADRGDPRTQYLLGIAHFNGDNVVKDWVRAYALVSLTQRAGLPQAAPALAQMDKYVPLDQRQHSVPLALELAVQPQATRQRQPAAIDLDATVASDSAAPKPSAPATIGHDSASTAGADYARPKAIAVSPSPRTPPPQRTPARVATRSIATATPTSSRAPIPVQSGGWRVQLGAFDVAANADKLWDQLKARPELAGHTKLIVQAGTVAKLQAGGFASEADARAACARLSAAGFPFLAVPS